MSIYYTKEMYNGEETAEFFSMLDSDFYAEIAAVKWRLRIGR